MKDEKMFAAQILDRYELQDILQNILDDKTIVLVMNELLLAEAYSSDSDTGYDHYEIVSRLEKYYDKRILRLYVDMDSVVIVFDN